ncbi:MAG: hypothetical protein ACTSRI_20060 [Promethearchaeota archaeon]
MVEKNYSYKGTQNAIKNFENIKKSIKGLYEIINFNLTDDDIYFKTATDNLTGLYQNLLELLLNNDGLSHVVKKIKNAEVELDIPLNELLIEHENKF